MTAYFHDAKKRVVYVAEGPLLSEDYGKWSPRNPHPDLQGWHASLVVRGTSAEHGEEDGRHFQHYYPTPRYSRDIAHGFATSHLQGQAGLSVLTRIEKDEYERLRAEYLAASQRTRP